MGEIFDTTDSEPIDLMDVDEQVFQLRFDFPEAFVSGSRQCWLYAYRKHYFTLPILLNAFTNQLAGATAIAGRDSCAVELYWAKPKYLYKI